MLSDHWREPRMRIERVVEIDASPARVWEVLADLVRWPEWTPSVLTVELLDAGPLRTGQRARLHQPGYRPATWTVTAVAEGVSFVWETRAAGMRTVAGHALEPMAGGTRVTLSIDVSGPTVPLLGWLVMRATRKFVPLEAAGLKRRSEGA